MRAEAFLRAEPVIGGNMTVSTILLILIILLLIGAVPAWPHSRGWGYGPSGLLGVVLLILIVLLLMGRL
jgi:carbon starvation protein CstA